MWIDLTDVHPGKRSQELLEFIVHRSGQKLSRTKLVKMMYMADHESMRYLGQPLSEFSWQRTDCGPVEPPFCVVEELLDDETITVEVHETKDGHTWHGYRPLGSEPAHSFSAAEVKILEGVIEAYATMDTDLFVREVVYETKPFLAVKNEPAETPIPMELVRDEGSAEMDGLDVKSIEAGRERLRSGQGVPLADAINAIRGRC